MELAFADTHQVHNRVEAHSDRHLARQCRRVQIAALGPPLARLGPRLLHARRLRRAQRFRTGQRRRRGAQCELRVGGHTGAPRWRVRAAGARVAAGRPPGEDGGVAGWGPRGRGTARGLLGGADIAAAWRGVDGPQGPQQGARNLDRVRRHQGR
jgi:hypothetical protein